MIAPRANFSMDSSEEEFLAGYMKGVAETVSTPQYIDSALEYASDYLKNRFEISFDQRSKLSPGLYHHVYEWGDNWASRHANVGNPAMRLWRLVDVDNGRGGRAVGFTFLPSVRPTPLHPQEIKYNVEEGKHIFTWKAPVMEYGQTVTISPVEALKGKLVFYWEKIGKVVATSKTIKTTPDPAVVGQFSAYFVNWWSNEAPVIFGREIKPQLEKNVVPRENGRFVKGRSKSASRALRAGGGVSGSRQRVNIDRANEARGYAEAVKAMQKIAAGYRQGRGGYDNYGH